MKRRVALFLCVLILLGCLLFAGVAHAKRELPTAEGVLSALYEADISTLRQAIDRGLISCEELTAYYLERIEDYNTPYNCFITLCNDALDVARKRDEQRAAGEGKGLLFGIPVVIKDNMDLTGYHTTNGLKFNDDQIAKSNAAVVDYLLSEGAVILGKTNMSTRAQDARASVSQVAGETKNAYGTLLASGGSSGGTAVAVSLNFAAAGLGSDTNSSLRLPAVLNGCVSMRTTFGLIPTDGIKPLNTTRDVAGAITRSVYDQAIMLDVLTQGKYQYTANLQGDSLQGLRIGILTNLTEPQSGSRTEKNIDDEIIAAFQAAAEVLRSCGAEVFEVKFPNMFTLSNATLDTNAASKKDAFYKAFEEMMTKNDLDAVIFPTYLNAPLKSGTDENGKTWNPNSQVFITNTRALSPSARLPEIGVPIGYHSRGAGIGMDIAARMGEEQLLLNIAYTYEQHSSPRKVPEGAPNTYADKTTGTLTELIDLHLSNHPLLPPPITEPPPVEPPEPIPQPLPEVPPAREYNLAIDTSGQMLPLAFCCGIVLFPLRKLFQKIKKSS